MKYIDTEHSEEYVLMLKRIIGEEESNQGVSISNFYYPVSDFALHVNPAYTFSIRMSSINTIKPEQVNGENLLGYYFGDGSTCITKSGFEYYNIMPLWDWNKIPGTTTPVKDSIPSNKGKVYGKAEFCGGVTDSCNGVASFSYFDDNPEVVTGASKSWFMFDDIIVCLGAGLQSEYDLQTTVEQCWGKDSFIIVSSKGNTYFGGNVSQENINAIGVLHDGIGYFFPESDFLSVSNMQKDGNWRIISNEQPDSILEGKVFTLCVNHKKEKTLKSELKYAYAIIPSSGTEYFEKFCNNPSFDIIVNSDSLQVVRNYSGDYGVVFFKKCNYTVGNYHFSSTRPCIYLLKTDLGGAYLCNPLKNEDVISISVKTPELNSTNFVDVEFNNDDNYKGKTKFVKLQNETTNIFRSNISNKRPINVTTCKNGMRIENNSNKIVNTLKVYNSKGNVNFIGGLESKKHIFINLKKGIYILSATYAENVYSTKVIVK